MAYINALARPLYAACLAALLLAGCASGPDQKPVSDEPVAEGEVEAIERIPNPYLAQAVDVPDAAAEQFRNALVLMQGENWSDAQEVLRPMTQTYPELAGPWVNLGITYWRQEQYAEAEEAFEKALNINPLHNDAYVQYGVMLREQGQFEKAESVYLRALEVWPHNLAVLRNLGILYDLYMGKHEQALELYELALRVMPEPSREMQGWIIDLKRRMARE